MIGTVFAGLFGACELCALVGLGGRDFKKTGSIKIELLGAYVVHPPPRRTRVGRPVATKLLWMGVIGGVGLGGQEVQTCCSSPLCDHCRFAFEFCAAQLVV